MLADLDSVNGTAVNGRQIERPTVLSHGDVVALGRTSLRVELEPRDARGEATVMRSRPAFDAGVRAA